MNIPYRAVFAVLCALVASPTFADADYDAHFTQGSLFNPFSKLDDAGYETALSEQGYSVQAEKPLTLAAFLEWSAASYPTAQNVYVLGDGKLQIGTGIYDN